MLSLRKPSADLIHSFLEGQSKLAFTYAAVGATAGGPPAGYNVDHTRIKLGEGQAVFLAAKSALQRWDQFNLAWLEAWPREAPIQTGQVVAVVARAAGMWWLNACRIVYVIEESGSIERFGFAYGTLPDHAGTGEERFLIEWNRTDNQVWYDILAFSRPYQVLPRIGYPMVRRTQKQFGRHSAAAMERAVQSARIP